MTRSAWLVILLGAGFGPAACTLTLGFEGLAGESRDGGAEQRDCADPKNAQKAYCNVVADRTPGSIGSGFTLNWKSLPGKEVVGGFIEGKQLVLAIHITSHEGIVTRVDLDNGKRELASGQVTDLSGTPYQHGSGPALEELRALRAKDSDNWVAHLWPNPSTFAGSLEPIRADGTRATAVALCSDCPGLAEGMVPRGTQSLIDPSGDSVWFAYHSADTGTDGVVRISTSDCKVFETPNIAPSLLAELDGRIWLLDVNGNALGALDPATEALTIVPGTGALGSSGLLVTSPWAWTIGQEVALSYTRVDKVNGDRQPLLGVTAPASLQVEHAPFAWQHPDGQKLVLALDGAVVILDPTTGMSQFVSY